MRGWVYLGMICCAAVLPVLGQGDSKPVNVPLEGPIAKLLSEYHLFKGDGSTQEPNDGVIPYDLSSPLFSDYANKHRFVWMPPGTSATYNPDQVFSFPVGAVLIKTFGYLHNMRDPSKGERLVETRLLVHRPNGWDALVYVWNEEQTDATLKVAGGTRDVNWIHFDGRERSVNYIIPNKNQCKSCHIYDKAVLPIGPKARNLNKDFGYSDGVENQLTRWARAGYLSGAPEPDEAPRLPVWDDPHSGSLENRARAWLEINCAHCHNPHGPADTTGLDLRVSQHDPTKWGVMKTPVAAGRGSGGFLYDIVPGKPDESILVYRLRSTEPGVMMPELPRRLVDEEGVTLIREWIAAMPAM